MSRKTNPQTAADMALQIIKKQGGVIRTKEALQAGIHPRVLYSLRDSGRVELISRGVYRLADLPPIANPDLATVSLRIPRAVICLVSALSFHNITTQIPHEVAIALERGTETPRMQFPPLSVHRFSRIAYQAGIEEHDIDGVTIRVYSPEKTLADCFKFRNKLGMDVMLEALKFYRERKKLQVGELLRYARICRVANVMKPYLEAML